MRLPWSAPAGFPLERSLLQLATSMLPVSAATFTPAMSGSGLRKQHSSVNSSLHQVSTPHHACLGSGLTSTGRRLVSETPCLTPRRYNFDLLQGESPRHEGSNRNPAII